MANILKRIRKSSLSSSANKHESICYRSKIFSYECQCKVTATFPLELLEEDDQAQEDPVVEGVQFNVKYLGSCAVDTDCGEVLLSA